MTRLFLDIETIPATRPDELARIALEVQAHNAGLKKPHPAEEVTRLVDEAHRKTSFDAACGEIVCIGAAIENGPAQSWYRDFRVDGSEAEMLTRFRNDMHEALDGRGAVVVGHNSIGFDCPFIRQRSLVLNVSLPAWLTPVLKPWEATDVDTMMMWTLGARGGHIGLDRLARALGLPGKADGIDGSKVWDFVVAGRIEEVARYCEADVDLTRRVFNRMRSVNEHQVAA